MQSERAIAKRWPICARLAGGWIARRGQPRLQSCCNQNHRTAMSLILCQMKVFTNLYGDSIYSF